MPSSPVFKSGEDDAGLRPVRPGTLQPQDLHEVHARRLFRLLGKAPFGAAETWGLLLCLVAGTGSERTKLAALPLLAAALYFRLWQEHRARRRSQVSDGTDTSAERGGATRPHSDDEPRQMPLPISGPD